MLLCVSDMPMPRSTTAPSAEPPLWPSTVKPYTLIRYIRNPGGIATTIYNHVRALVPGGGRGGPTPPRPPGTADGLGLGHAPRYRPATAVHLGMCTGVSLRSAVSPARVLVLGLGSKCWDLHLGPAVPSWRTRYKLLNSVYSTNTNAIVAAL